MTLRPATRDDIPAIVELFEAGRLAFQEPYGQEDEVRVWLTSPKVDLERDVRLRFDHGRLVGYVDVDPLGENPVRWWCDIRPHPDSDFGAIVPELLEWAEARAGAGLLRTWCPSTLDALRAAFERRGLRRLRSSYRMEIELGDAGTRPELPEGVDVHPLREGEERIAYEVHDEAFRDSWEHVSDPYEEWRHYFVDTDSFDPTLWFLAWDSGDPAGVAMCRGRAGVGWVDVLGVRRPWRRRGLGRALLLHVFGEFRRRGLTRAGLGVDAESLTGANRLYEAVGMTVARELEIFEKPL